MLAVLPSGREGGADGAPADPHRATAECGRGSTWGSARSPKPLAVGRAAGCEPLPRFRSEPMRRSVPSRVAARRPPSSDAGPRLPRPTRGRLQPATVGSVAAQGGFGEPVEGWQDEQRKRDERLAGRVQRWHRPVWSLLLVAALVAAGASAVATSGSGLFWVTVATSAVLAAWCGWQSWTGPPKAGSSDGNGTST